MSSQSQFNQVIATIAFLIAVGAVIFYGSQILTIVKQIAGQT